MQSMNTTDTHITALILGATGKTGRRVVARLSSAGHSVRAGRRPRDFAAYARNAAGTGAI
jgi:uncharacterized protein YbjT (DUF2867 family)